MRRGQKKGLGYDRSVYRSFVLIMQFGINMIVPIGMMSALGIWMDGKFHTAFWTILLFFVGAIAGGQNVYRMARAVYASDEKNRSSKHAADVRNVPTGQDGIQGQSGNDAKGS